MKVLVTGGAGFIGSNYVKHLFTKFNNEELEVIVLDKLTYAGSIENLQPFLTKPNFKFIHGDICDFKVVSELVPKINRLINFAAESHVDRSIESSSEFIKTNVLGTQVLLDAIKENPSVRFLHVSTDEVYGSIERGSWDEKCSIKPNSPYAASKAASDLLVLAYQNTYSLDLMISRCCNNYGPNQFPEKIFPLFITNLIQKKKIPIYGNGKNIREWIHVEDHCRALELILEKGKSGETYNVGTGFELTNLELAVRLIEYFNLDKSMISYTKDRLGHDYRYSLDIRKITDNLGYKPKMSFSEGVENTINWYKDNSQWWNAKIKK